VAPSAFDRSILRGREGNFAEEEIMQKKITALVLVLGSFAAIVGLFALSTPAYAGATCWQVDCNTCCRGKGGGVICTQRACV